MFKDKKLSCSILVVLLAVTTLVWWYVFDELPSDFLEVHFFDVGQGDSIFIETPAGRQVLIDGGPDNTILEKLNQVMPFYDRSIDLVIATHPDADHLTGLISVLDYYKVNCILVNGLEKKTAVYQKWQETIMSENSSLAIARSGQQIVLEKGIVMDILWPEMSSRQIYQRKSNNLSIVSRLVYGQIEFLLPGDIEQEIEKQLLEQSIPLKSDVLKVAHHGSKTSSSYNFIKEVNPQIAIISVGRKNYYQHPHQEVLKRLKNIFIYRTDRDGDINVITDGYSLKVEPEKSL